MHVDGRERVEFFAKNQVESGEWLQAIGSALFSVSRELAPVLRNDEGEGSQKLIETACTTAATRVSKAQRKKMDGSTAMLAFEKHLAGN